MHMRKQYEVFGCIPHGRGAYQEVGELVSEGVGEWWGGGVGE